MGSSGPSIFASSGGRRDVSTTMRHWLPASGPGSATATRSSYGLNTQQMALPDFWSDMEKMMTLEGRAPAILFCQSTAQPGAALCQFRMREEGLSSAKSMGGLNRDRLSRRRAASTPINRHNPCAAQTVGKVAALDTCGKKGMDEAVAVLFQCELVDTYRLIHTQKNSIKTYMRPPDAVCEGCSANRDASTPPSSAVHSLRTTMNNSLVRCQAAPHTHQAGVPTQPQARSQTSKNPQPHPPPTAPTLRATVAADTMGTPADTNCASSSVRANTSARSRSVSPPSSCAHTQRTHT